MIHVHLIPIIPHNDNYAYILEAENGEVAVVDPGEAGPLIDFLEQKKLKPNIILITHHHWDHIDGLADMLSWHSCPVAGPASETARIKPLDILLDERSDFSFGGERVQILETPGHTRGHICFYFPESQFLLAADTLFSMGCGRLFEGTAEQMFKSLQKIVALPDETLLYSGHEYTLSNAEFCLKQAPDNKALQSRYEEVKKLRADNKPTIPVSLGIEKQTNLFLMAETADEFAHLRALKDQA